MLLVVDFFMALCRPLVFSVCINLLRSHSPGETQFLATHLLWAGLLVRHNLLLKKVNNGRKMAIDFDSPFSLQ